MKKTLALVLALVLVGLLVACGGSPSSSTAPPPAASAATGSSAAGTPEPEPIVPQTISFWYSVPDAGGQAIEEAVRAFNEGPGAELQITVEPVFQGAVADATTKMRSILQNDQASQLPDLMQIDATGILDYRTSDYAFSVDAALANDPDADLSQLNGAAVKNWSYDDTQWGLPLTITTHVMFYNKTMLEAAGVTQAPTTFAEIIEAAGKLPANNSAGQKLSAYAQVPSSIYLAYWIGQIPGKDAGASYVVNNRNGRAGLATELVCDQEGTLLKFLTEWKAMYDAGALLNSSDGLQELFLTEQTAIMTGDTANTVSLINQIDGRFELGCTLFPRIDEDSNFGNQVSGSAICMFNKGDDAKAMAAWELMKYLTSAEPQANLGLATGYIPANSASFDIQAYKDYITEYPQMKVGPEQLEMTSPDNVGINVGPSINFYLEVQEKVSTMLTSGDTPEATVEKMAESLNAMLAEYAKANQ